MSTTPGIKVEGKFSGIVTYSDGNELRFMSTDIYIERNTEEGTLRIVANSGGSIILEFKDVPGGTVSVPVTRAEVKHNEYPYAVGYEGTVQALYNTDDKLKSPTFSAKLKDQAKNHVRLTGNFDINPSSAGVKLS